MQRLTPLTPAYTPWSGMAMRPSAVTTILNEIVVNRRTSITECGGGISTLYIARLLAQLGRGSLHTIEHDPGWASVLQELLERAKIESFVTVTVAPLAPSRLALDGQLWYSDEVLDGLGADSIDLLLVDGPVAFDAARRHARYPALPYFASRLAKNCTLIIDDIWRQGEQGVVDRWELESAFRFERRFTEGGIAIARRGEGFAVSS